MRVTDNLQETARAMVNTALKRYGVKESPRVLLWTAWFKETCEDKGWPVPAWVTRRSFQSKRHLDQHRKFLASILDREYAVFALTINGNVTRWIGHGKAPIRDENRTDAWWRMCVPSAKNKTVGFFLMPAVCKDCDHPFLIEALKRASYRATSHFANSYSKVDAAFLGGLLSDDRKQGLLRPAKARVLDAMAQAERPLLITQD